MVLDDAGDVDKSVTPTLRPSRETIEWATKFTTDALEAYGVSVRNSVAYAFGAGASRLRRRTRSRHASDCYLRIRSSKPDWRVEIRFDSDGVIVEAPDPGIWLTHALDPNEIRRSPEGYFRLRRSFSSRSDYYPSLNTGLIAAKMRSTLFETWPHGAIHLPADRTGIMQSHNVLAGATARQAAQAGIRPIQIETLPGTSADFLSLVFEILDGMPHARPGRSRFASVVRDFEKDLRAKIEVDRKADGVDAIVAVTAEGRFPMARASSMLSELAPLLLVLQSPYTHVDHLTIDEPEAHLHPEMQVRVASFLATLVSLGVGVVVTTHSDFFISQFNNMMRVHELSSRSTPSGLRSLPNIDRSRVRSLHFSRVNGWCVARMSEPGDIDGVDESTFTSVMRSQYNETARLVNELVDTAAE